MTIPETLQQLAAAGHSRTSAHKALGWSWHTFRQYAADYPEIQWRKPGEHMKAGQDMTNQKGEQMGEELDRIDLMDLFRLDMTGIEPTRVWQDDNPHPSFKMRPSAFKYEHSEYLFKVWCAGRSRAAQV